MSGPWLAGKSRAKILGQTLDPEAVMGEDGADLGDWWTGRAVFAGRAGPAQDQFPRPGTYGSDQEVTNASTSCQGGLLPSGTLLFRNALAEGGPLNIATLKQDPALRAEAAVDRALHCARVAEDNKARDIVILDMRGITPLFDFQVLVTGASRRQIHTLAEEIDAAMRADGDSRLSIEG